MSLFVKIRLHAVLLRTTEHDAETLKAKIWICTLAQRFKPADVNLSIDDVKFASVHASWINSPLENLIILVPREILLNEGLMDDSTVLAGNLPPSNTLSWSAHRDLVTQCYLVLSILGVLVSRVPRLLWSLEMHEKRSRTLPAQRVIAEIASGSSVDFTKLCDDAGAIYIDHEKKTSYLSLFGERSIRENMAELSRILSRPRPATSWKMLEYPAYTLPDAQQKALSNRLAAAIQITKSTNAENDATARQEVYEALSEAHRQITNVLNTIAIKLAHARQDMRTWSETGPILEKEVELALDYERVSQARKIYESLLNELNHLKVLTRRHERFTESQRRLLPPKLALLYDAEYRKALSQELRGGSRGDLFSSASSNALVGSGSTPTSSSSKIQSPAVGSAHTRTYSHQLVGSSGGSHFSPTTSIDETMSMARDLAFLKRRVNELELERADARKRFDEILNDNVLLKSKVSDSSSDQQQQEHKRHAELVEELRGELSDLKASYAAEQAHNSQLSDSVADQLTSKTETERQLREKRDEVAHLHAELNDMKACLETTMVQSATLESELRRAKSQNITLEAELRKVQEENQKSVLEASTAQSQIENTANAQLLASKARLDATHAQLDASLLRLESLEKSLEDARSERARLDTEYREAEASRLLEQTNALRELSDRVDAEKRANLELSTRLSQTASEHAEVAKANEIKLTELNENFKLASSQLSKANEELVKREKEVADKEALVRKREDELSELVAQNIIVTEERDQLKEERVRSGLDEEIARKLHEEFSPGSTPEAIELGKRTKAELIKLVVGRGSELKRLQDEAHATFVDLQTRLRIAENQVGELLRQQSLRQSSD